MTFPRSKIRYRGEIKPLEIFWWLLLLGNDIIVEDKDMREEVIGDFVCRGNHMVIVRLEHGAHVMTYDEWKSIYGKFHPERWENLKRNRKTA